MASKETESVTHANEITMDEIKTLLRDIPQDNKKKDKKKPIYGVATPLFVSRDLNIVVPVDHYNEVYPGIYLGDHEIAHDKEALRRIKATHILNAAQGSKFNQIDTTGNYYADLQLKFMGISAVDTPRFKLVEHFFPAADFIEECLQNNGVVVVHCHQGLSRSATIVLAFLMAKRQMTLREAINTVKVKRPIYPNEGFLKQLIKLDGSLMQKNQHQKGEPVS